MVRPDWGVRTVQEDTNHVANYDDYCRHLHIQSSNCLVSVILHFSGNHWDKIRNYEWWHEEGLNIS